MVEVMANMTSLQAPPQTKAVSSALKSPRPLHFSPYQSVHHTPLLSNFLATKIPIKSFTGSSRNSHFSVKSRIEPSSHEYEQTETTHIGKYGMQKLGEFNGPESQNEILHFPGMSALTGVVALVPFLVDTEKAFAINGDFGLLEGRSASLIHPIVMGGLFVYTLWTGYLGWQWRRIRTIQDEINELKKQVKPQPKKEGDPPAPPSPIETKIQQLTEERKGLLKGSFRDRHYNAGSILLGFGVFEALGGGFNTWVRAGKLFPGPHLFAGAGITILWALAAALVPAMQKGNGVARNLHIALNAVNVLLFIWQIPTGIEIVLKVLEFTTWP
uniref:DUF4079 domain-containing protein n=1 Tax=Picea sitchensis TaxID=3332 RepID=A9NZT2_PICSI|nr:unknown [Picea sitchensis]